MLNKASGAPRYGPARRGRNQTVLVLLLVLVLDCPISDYENQDDDEDERFAQPATIWTDTDRMLAETRPTRAHCPGGELVGRVGRPAP